VIMQALRTRTRAIMIVVVIVFVASIFGMYITRGSRPSGPQGVEGDFPVASIGGEQVMASHIVMGVRNYAQQTGQSDLSVESIVSMRKQVLNSIAMQHMLQLEAKRQKIEVPKEEIDAAVKRIEGQFPTKEAFQQYMDNSGIKMKDLQEQIRVQLAQRMVLDASAGNVEVTDEEALEFYEETKDLFFRQPEGYSVMFARFKTREEAEAVKKALDDGKNWDEAMEGYKESAIDYTLSGEPAFVTLRDLEEGLLKPIADTPIGKVSEPIAVADNDFAVVIKLEKKEETIATFDEANAEIRNMIAQQKRHGVQNEYLEGLLQQANIKILAPEFFEVPPQEAVEGETGGETEAQQEEEASE